MPEDTIMQSMKIIQNKAVDFLLPSGFVAITFWYIFARTDTKITPTLLNHEAIHRSQQAEITLIGFVLIYIIEWLILAIWGVVKGEDNPGMNSYRAIRFEKEAYAYEGDINYLKTRKEFAWFKIPFGYKIDSV